MNMDFIRPCCPPKRGDNYIAMFREMHLDLMAFPQQAFDQFPFVLDGKRKGAMQMSIAASLEVAEPVKFFPHESV